MKSTLASATQKILGLHICLCVWLSFPFAHVLLAHSKSEQTPLTAALQQKGHLASAQGPPVTRLQSGFNCLFLTPQICFFLHSDMGLNLYRVRRETCVSHNLGECPAYNAASASPVSKGSGRCHFVFWEA